MVSRRLVADPRAHTVIVLLTRDLRVHDQTALATACRHGRRVVPLFVHDPAIYERSGGSPNRQQFLAESLADLRNELAQRGGQLFVRQGDTTAQTMRVAAQTDAQAVFVSDDVSRFARERLRQLSSACEQQRLHLQAFPGVTVVPPGQLTRGGRDHYKVFTPYWEQWRSTPWPACVAPPRQVRVPAALAPGRLRPSIGSADRQASRQLPHGGETEARIRVRRWLRAGVGGYGAGHDDLAGNQTSRLSPYLHFGCVSPAELAHKAGRVAGAEPFVRQLCWRDFHHQVTAAFPELPYRDYRPGRRQWRHDPGGLDAWRTGLTGIPIVDAGMRQLESEGWMHNRARLLVAAFLTRDLAIDWRHGAEHFMKLLVDADVANNYGNWQWVAGTGNDTRPNRRFNVLRQAHRYDPQGDYVRRYVQELSEIPGRAVHEPWKLDGNTRRRLDYPAPIGLETGR
jgi:deoxyribodipyrimidine photo-lyase